MNRFNRRWFVFIFLFLLAFGVRLKYVSEESILQFHSGRQYRSALIARDIYYQIQPPIEKWKPAVSLANRQQLGMLEPPVMEYLSAWLYRLRGREDLRFFKMLSSFFWLLGGIPFYGIACRLWQGFRQNKNSEGFFLTPPAIALGFYLLFPYGVVMSASLHPDPLMMALWLSFIWTALRYSDESSVKRLFGMTLAAAFTVLSKPQSIFFVLGAFFPLLNLRGSDPKGSDPFWFKKLFHPHALFFYFFGLLPPVLFYAYYKFYDPYFSTSNLSTFFIPELFLKKEFWKAWIILMGDVVGYFAFFAGLAASFAFQEKKIKNLMLGLWLAYFLFGVCYNRNIYTHNHYHLFLIPMISLAMISLWQLGLTQSMALPKALRFGFFTLMAGGLAVISLSKTQEAFAFYQMPEFEERKKIAVKIGEGAGHSAKLLNHSWAYGRFLYYYGETAGDALWEAIDLLEQGWPEKLPSGEEHLKQFEGKLNRKDYDYFVITDKRDFGEKALSQLNQRYCWNISKEDYVIYDLKKIAVK